MRIRFVLTAAMAATVILQPFAAQQPAQQAPPERPSGKGIIEVRITRAGSPEGVPEVNVTLQGPAIIVTAEQVSQLFTPSSSLTAAQRQQVDQIIQTGFSANVTAEVIANAAQRLQAQLLGQPAPAASPATAAQRQLAQPADLILMTDADGRANFQGLPPGRYTIRGQREGYYGALAAGATQPSSVVNGTVTLKDTDEAPAALAFTMTRGVVLGGRVRDPEGRPAVGVVINAQQPVYQNGRTVLNTVNQSQTDDRGVFRMFWLPPGNYYVSATVQRDGEAFISSDGRIIQRGNAASARDSWAKTYFPGVVDARNAVPVNATEGGELNGLDFAIQAEAVGQISGHILNPFKDANGKMTTPSSTLTLVPHGAGEFTDAGTLTFQNVASDRNNGEFEIRGILPGLYDLVASAPTGPANPSGAATVLTGGTLITSLASPTGTATGRVRVDVGKDAVRDVTVPLKAGIEVRVRVAIDGAAPPFTMSAPPQTGNINVPVVEALIARGIPTADALAASRAAANPAAPAQVATPRVRLTLQAKDNAQSSNATSQAHFDPSGIYTFLSVPQGNYRVQVANLPTSESYVADIRLAGASIYDDGLLVDGTMPGDIELDIVSKGARLQGRVTNVESRPATNAIIALVPAETRRQNPALYKTTRTNDMGNFTINGVAPGLYKLFAWEDAPNSAWQNARFLALYEQLGEAATVIGGESLSMNLKLIPKTYGR